MILIAKKGALTIEVLDENGRLEVFSGSTKEENEGDAKVKKIIIKNRDKDKPKIPYWDKYFVFSKKGQPKLRVFLDSNGDYHPIHTVYDSETGNIKDQVDYKNMKFWYTVETRDGYDRWKKKQSTLEKMLPAIALIVGGMLFFFAMYWSYDSSVKTSSQINAFRSETVDLTKTQVTVMNETKKVLQEVVPIIDNMRRGSNFVGVVNE